MKFVTTVVACSLLLIAAMFIFSGAGSRERRLGPVAAAAIRNGISTRTDVAALLGRPQETIRQVPLSPPPGSPQLHAKYLAPEIWRYAGSDGTKGAFFVTVYFDAAGKVLECETLGE